MEKAYISQDNIGRRWVTCPYCHKRNFPVSPNTEIHDLEWLCKNNKRFCKKKFLIDVEPVSQSS